jgi:DNA helicase IV
VTAVTSSAFDLPERLISKADPALIATDERHFAAIGTSLATSITDLQQRLDTQLRTPAGEGQETMDRDLEVHRLEARLRTLRRFGLDLCLGRMVLEDDPEPVYVGRLGLTDRTGRRLLVDWRSPVAEPFFAATRANPMGLVSRRRYRWSHGHVSDFWDEVFSSVVTHDSVALDDDSAFIASLGSSRSSRMRDVLTTIQADQDAIIRAGSRGALVVDGGPGTGKTVVALHRTAYLLYADPRLGHRRGGVLVVGPHQPYLAYVSDVLPSLGEEGVQTCTLRDLVPEGVAARPESEADVAALKATARMVQAIEPAVLFYEEPPTTATVVSTDWSDATLTPADWADAFAAPDPGTPHNEAREQVWDQLLTILVDKHDDDLPRDLVRRALARSDDLLDAFGRAWPVLEPTDVVGDLWSVPAYLRRCAPWLSSDEVRMLQRPDPHAWTVSDLPLLDAARQRLGDSATGERRRRREAAEAASRTEMATVISDLIASDDSEMLVMSMLRGDDLKGVLVDTGGVPTPEPDLLAGPFAHVVVDEAQELTEAEWQMLLLRCPSGSFTIVGDRAQARHGFAGSWPERLARAGIHDVTVSTLTINYRTPEEVMAAAEPVIRAVLPDANVPTSIRPGGVPVRYGMRAELDEILNDWLASHSDGVACVIGDPTVPDSPRVRSLTPVLAKGLEFDLVVVVDPDGFGPGVEGAVDRYVSMTRTTHELVILTSS